jgi:hypothetical protein
MTSMISFTTLVLASLLGLGGPSPAASAAEVAPAPLVAHEDGAVRALHFKAAKTGSTSAPATPKVGSGHGKKKGSSATKGASGSKKGGKKSQHPGKKPGAKKGTAHTGGKKPGTKKPGTKKPGTKKPGMKGGKKNPTSSGRSNGAPPGPRTQPK